eukprot:8818287-Ditylum_brightwellii.AAC.1
MECNKRRMWHQGFSTIGAGASIFGVTNRGGGVTVLGDSTVLDTFTFVVGTVTGVHSTLVSSCCTGAFVVEGSTLSGGTDNVTGSGCCSNCGTCKGVKKREGCEDVDGGDIGA